MKITTEQWNTWDIVKIEGEFVVRVLNSIRDVLETIEKKVSPFIAIDFSQVSYIDSSAITLLLNFQKRLSAEKGRLVLFGPSEDIQSILSIVNVANFIAVYADRNDFEKEVQKN